MERLGIFNIYSSLTPAMKPFCRSLCPVCNEEGLPELLCPSLGVLSDGFSIELTQGMHWLNIFRTIGQTDYVIFIN